MTSETDTLFTAAVEHHRAGRLRDAEALYRRVLEANPNHSMALQFLGILAHQLGRNDDAIALLGKAIALNGQVPDSHYKIGGVFQFVGRLEEAASHYSKAIALKADFAEAHYELANVFVRQEKLGEAAAQYQCALMLRPNYVEVLNNLGTVLYEQGKRDEAIGRWRQALVLRPQDPGPLMNIGLALKQQGKLDEAVAHLRQVLSLKSDYAEAHYSLGNALQGLGQWDEARAAYRRGLHHKPDLFAALNALVSLLLTEGNITEALELAWRAVATKETPETKSAFVACLCSPLIHPRMGDLRSLLVRALSEPWARPSDLAPASARFLPLNDAIRQSMTRAVKAWPNLLLAEELYSSENLAAIAEDSLLRALLETTPVYEVGLERFVTALRFTLLDAATTSADSAVAEPVLSLYCAIARQCFINNYVFAQSNAEIEAVRVLCGELIAALSIGAAILPHALAAVAAYVPLHSLPNVESLLNRSWPESVTAVLEQQIRGPIEERHSRHLMPVLTKIEDDVSTLVRGQYEENPYPQWVKVVTATKPETVDALMRQKFPLSPFIDLGKTGGIEILVAGCGTGQHPITTSQRFKAAQVLAVDLSLTSLCYAQRMTRELGLGTIHYAQADIVKLPSIGRTFDVIECSGVLHHLADPLAGWRALLSMLRPHGIMLLGLYSEIGRRDIVATRDFIAERGYQPTADDIRRCRQDLLDCAEGTLLKNATASGDFFSLSECRDLLFHVHEHRLSLPEIATFIVENNLQFIGFDLDPINLRNYARQFSSDVAMTDLTQWQRYEIENPRTFNKMYQFWVQKK